MISAGPVIQRTIGELLLSYRRQPYEVIDRDAHLRRIMNEIMSLAQKAEENPNKDFAVLDFGCGRIANFSHYIYSLFAPLFPLKNFTIIACDNNPFLHSFQGLLGSYISSWPSLLSGELWARISRRRKLNFVREIKSGSCGDVRLDLIVALNVMMYTQHPIPETIELLGKLKKDGVAYIHLEPIYVNPVNPDSYTQLFEGQQGPIFVMRRADIKSLKAYVETHPVIPSWLREKCSITDRLIHWERISARQVLPHMAHNYDYGPHFREWTKTPAEHEMQNYPFLSASPWFLLESERKAGVSEVEKLEERMSCPLFKDKYLSVMTNPELNQGEWTCIKLAILAAFVYTVLGNEAVILLFLVVTSLKLCEMWDCLQRDRELNFNGTFPINQLKIKVKPYTPPSISLEL